MAIEPRHRGTALVTGASSGIGAATARRLHEAGFGVVATARDPERLADLHALGCRTLALDVTDEGSMAAAVAAAGPISVLVNNAGYGLLGPLEELPIADVRAQFETNVFGLLRLTQLVLPGMRTRGQGRIVILGSIGGRVTFPGAGAYHMTKYALEALADALRFEVAPFGVSVSLVEPAAVRTNLAVAGAEVTPPAPESSPYAGFRVRLARLVESAYGPDARGILTPEHVAETIRRAATADRPRSRYRVGASAAGAQLARGLLPDRAWDAALRRLYASA